MYPDNRHEIFTLLEDSDAEILGSSHGLQYIIYAIRWYSASVHIMCRYVQAYDVCVSVCGSPKQGPDSGLELAEGIISPQHAKNRKQREFDLDYSSGGKGR